MATAITIKRYNSTTGNWDELAPKTTIAQVDGLQTQLNGKQATLTFDSSPTQSSDNPVKSGGVFTAISNVRAVAEGKTKTYVTGLYQGQYLAFGSSALNIGSSPTIYSDHYKEVTDSTDMLDVGTSDTYLYLFDEDGETLTGNVLLENLKTGDVLLIIDTDVPDFWFDYPYIYKMETTKVDLSDYLTTSDASSTYVAKTAGVTNISWDSTNYKIQKTINGSTTDVVTLKKVATTGSYSDLTNKPTIPATNVIPSESTANKILLSTSTGGTAAWSSSAIGGAAYKGVTDNSSAADVTSSDQNLITGRTLYYQLAKKGYTTNSGTVTSVGITTTANNGLSVSGTVSTSGNLTVGFASNHSSVLYADSEPSNKVSGQILFEY